MISDCSWIISVYFEGKSDEQNEKLLLFEKGKHSRWFFLPLKYIIIEPRHDKTNKLAVRPAKTQISLGSRPVFVVRMKKAWVLSYPLSSQRRLWSDWADAQADLSLRWAHRSFCWFCHVAAQLMNFIDTAYHQKTPVKKVIRIVHYKRDKFIWNWSRKLGWWICYVI